MTFSYLLCPFLAWFVAGSAKFMIHSVLNRKMAFDKIGYGGLPSTHTAIVSSLATLIAFTQGISSPVFGVSLGLTLIVIIDAIGLRRQIGRHAQAINRLSHQLKYHQALRESMGHQLHEIIAGLIVGGMVGFFLYIVF